MTCCVSVVGEEASPASIDEATPYIQAIADGLNHDPVRIYEWVCNSIEYTPYSGLKRGAHLTALEREGNDMDCAALLVALFKASGFPETAYKYQFSVFTVATEGHDGINASAWLGVEPGAVAGQFESVKHPVNPNPGSIQIPHVWVSFLWNDKAYKLVPSFKTYERNQPYDLEAANIGYSPSAVSAVAAGIQANVAGSASATAYTGVLAGKTALRTKLSEYSASLVAKLESENSALSGMELVGGRKIQFQYLAGLPEDFPSAFEGNVHAAGVLQIPEKWCVELEIKIGGITYKTYTSDFQGRKIGLWYTNRRGELWLDDHKEVTEDNFDPTENAQVDFTYIYPTGDLEEPQWTDTVKAAPLVRSGSYVVSYSFGKVGGRLQARLRRQAEYTDAKYKDSERKLLTENLDVMSLQYLNALSELNEIAGAATRTRIHLLHHAGITGQTDKPYVDLPLNQIGVWPAVSSGSESADKALSKRVGIAANFWFSMMEHVAIEQLIDGEGASTVRMLQRSVELGKPIYLAKSWDDYLSVRPLLVNYPKTAADTRMVTSIEDGLRAGGQLLIPKDNAMGYNDYTGTGYMLTQPRSDETITTMGISGGLSGGIFTTAGTLESPKIAWYFDATPSVESGSSPFTRVGLSDPVDMSNGSFFHDATDLTLAGESVHGLSLSRRYSTTRRTYDPTGLGKGWNHSYNIQVFTRHANDFSLQRATAAEVVPLYVGLKALIDIYDPTATAKEYTLGALVACWLGDQLVNTRTTVTMGNDSFEFVQMPDGTFAPPAGVNATLVKNSDKTHTLTFRKGSEIKFRALDGKFTSIIDRNNSTGTARTLTATYYSSGRLNRVTDAYGRYLSFLYDGDDRLSSVADSTGRTVYYSFDQIGETKAFVVLDPQGNRTRYHLDKKNRVTAVEDGEGEITISSSYNDFDQVTEQLNSGLATHKWEMGFTPGVARETDPEGHSSWHYYDERGRRHLYVDPVGAVTTLLYDGHDRVVTSANALGQTEEFNYNRYHELTQVINADNQSRTIIPSGDNTPGNNLAIEQNFESQETTVLYSTYHKPLTVTAPGGIISEYQYDSRGRILKARPAAFEANKWITYTYTDSGYLKRVIATYPDLSKEISDFNPQGDLIQFIDRLGRRTTYIYDNNHRPLEVAQWAGPVATASSPVGGTPPAGSIIQTTTYDANGRVRSVTQDGKTITYTYDSQGNVTEMWGPDGRLLADNYYDSRNLLCVSFDARDEFSIYDYDPAKRLMKTTDPLGRISRQGHDLLGRVSWTRSPKSYETNSIYNTVGHLDKVQDAEYGTTYPINYDYDKDGRRTAVINRLSNTFKTSYKDTDRKVADQTPLDTAASRSLLVERNLRGLPVTVTEPSGQVTTMDAYDAEGRVLRQLDGAGVYTQFTYLANGLLATVSEPVTSTGADIAGQTKTTTRTYDDFGRVATYAYENADGEVSLLKYEYDLSSNLTKLTYPDNKEVHYTYDAYNRLSTVTDWASRETTYTYDEMNRVTKVTRHNGTERNLVFDAAGQLRFIEERRTSGTSPIIWLRSLHYGKSGNDHQFSLNDGELTATYDFPSLGGVATFADTVTFNPDNQIGLFNGGSVAYDADGNMTTGPKVDGTGGTYDYDTRNRLISADGITYRYNPDGLRVQAGTVTEVADPAGGLSHVLARTDGGTTKWYVWGLGLLYEVDAAGGTRTYHHDQVGSTVAITDGAGAVTGRVEYNPFGTVVASEGNIATPFLFHGQAGIVTDPNGLLFMRARFYHPRLMRFLNADPIRFEGGMNWYAAFGNNPLSFIDPTGFGAEAPNSGEIRAYQDPGAGWGLAGGAAFLRGLGNTLKGYGSMIAHPIDAYRSFKTICEPLTPYGSKLDNFLLSTKMKLQSPYGRGSLMADIAVMRGASLAGPTVGAFRAGYAPKTVGDILYGAHTDSMIHITVASRAELAGGLDAGSVFVRLGDVSHMTLAEYQASVVGRAAAGYTSDVTAFVVSAPGAAEFIPWYEMGAAGVAESASVGRVVPSSYVPLPK